MDSEKSELINEVGSVLALLANQNGGILLPNLLKSYQKETGKVFPLRKMGYINPAEVKFLNHLLETCKEFTSLYFCRQLRL